MEKSKLWYGLAPFGAYTLVGQVAAGEYYEATTIDSARERVSCAEDLQRLETGALPNNCNDSQLKETYGKPASSTTEWTLVDGVLHEVEVKDTEYTEVENILVDSEAYLEEKLAFRDDYEHTVGLIAGGITAAAIIAGGVYKWRKNRRLNMPEATKQKPGLFKRSLGRLGLIEIATPTEDQSDVRERQFVEVEA